jgi:methionine aminopeptidase
MLIVFTDYTLGNPDTLTKYKVAAEISQKVLKEVSGASCVLHANRDVV